MDMEVRTLALALALLAAAGATRAAVFTVGPTGTHATLQAGFEAAAALPGSHEVRVASGVHHGRALLEDRIANVIAVSGGWNATFDSPYLTGPTVLDGDAGPRTVTARITRGARVSLRFLTIRDGRLDPDPAAFVVAAYGGGLDATLGGASELELSHLVVAGNRIHIRTPACTAAGAGASIVAAGNARVRVYASQFEDNWITEEGFVGPRLGGGLYLRLSGTARAEVRRNTFVRNGASGTGEMGAGALHLRADTSVLAATVVDNRFEDNQVAGALAPDPAGAGLVVDARATVPVIAVEARRNRFVRNKGVAQVRLLAQGGAAIVAADSLIQGGPTGGVKAHPDAGGQIALNNLTVTHNSGTGIDVAGAAYVFNTIAFANGTDLALGPGAFASSNLVAVDPLFEPGSLYRIQAGSPARDHGTNSPPGGLGPQDLDLETRLVGPRVDVGAHEWRP